MRRILSIINRYDPGVFPEDLRELGVTSKPVVLSSNENPYEPSENVRRAYLEAVSSIRVYPDPEYRELKRRLSEYTGFEVENIAVGCGASELIGCIANAVIEVLDRVVIPLPSYTMYLIFSMLREASVVTPVFDGYNINAEVVAKSEPKLTFVCSPNNPTGNTVDENIVREMAENSEYLVVDEAYAEFSDKTLTHLVDDYENVIVLRSFSKFFGLAGMRVGYAIASPEIAAAIEKIRLPFAISGAAVATAIAALESVDYYREVARRIVEERERLVAKLSRFDFLQPYKSDANFVLVKVKNGIGLAERLIRKGIIVRDVTGLMGLEGEHVRITVGRREENDALLEVLKDIDV